MKVSEFEEIILEFHMYCDLDFRILLDIAEANEIEIEVTPVSGNYGVATPYGIYLSPELFTLEDYEEIYYIILHEIAHYLRIQKLGFDTHLKNLSVDNFPDFWTYILDEEKIADRWASYIFYKVNGRVLDINKTQNLSRQERKSRLLRDIYELFGRFDGTEESYKSLLKEFIDVIE